MVRGFEALANAIMDRWASERDIWVAPSEVEEARAYLAANGVRTHAQPDGTFQVEGEPASACDPVRLVLLGLRRVHAARRSASAR
jgi:hypothetical protein